MWGACDSECGLQEIKMFLANECPTGWTEATERGGYMLMDALDGLESCLGKQVPTKFCYLEYHVLRSV